MTYMTTRTAKTDTTTASATPPAPMAPPRMNMKPETKAAGASTATYIAAKAQNTPTLFQ